MRISDWSSDVCSSDLASPRERRTSIAAPIASTVPDNVRAISRPSSAAPLASTTAIDAPDCAKRRSASRARRARSEEHTSELQSLMRISYAVFCLKKKKHLTSHHLYRPDKT